MHSKKSRQPVSGKTSSARVAIGDRHRDDETSQQVSTNKPPLDPGPQRGPCDEPRERRRTAS